METWYMIYWNVNKVFCKLLESEQTIVQNWQTPGLYFIQIFVNGSQLAKMKKSIPDISLP